jgi:DNA-binding NarL/FixJ family response regulator
MSRKLKTAPASDQPEFFAGPTVAAANADSPTNASVKKRILIVDDHPIMRRGQAELINRDPGLKVCAEVGSAAAALQAVMEHSPDLVMLDLNLPDKNGLELLKDLHAQFPRLSVLVVSMQDESYYALRVLRAGGRGYLMKQEGAEMLIAAVRRVLDGQVYVSDRMSARILGNISGPRNQHEGHPEDQLSDRELDVVRLFGEGWSAEEIARKLHLSSKTVDVHRANIKAKLGFRTTPEFLRFAIGWAAANKS